ncbi:MAG: lipoate--protein ligase [Bacteroidales bacterium]|nr:lipoate--protein ligase [Bacteroidales bacterium]
MLIVKRHHTNPYFNLAAEEYFLKETGEDIFMLWRNEPAIIVGKHQNTLSEINLDYVKGNNIRVVRRLTGGGAVFHDLGNLNFTFIQSNKDHTLNDFRKYTEPILDVLQALGIDARFEGRNDLTIEGKKFSGNAEMVWKNRVLHHGTLLFSATMTDLSQALKVNEAKFQDKAVKSVRSRVTNISEHLHQPMDVMQFSELIEKHIVSMYPDARFYELTSTDEQIIEEMVKTKYGTWDWNFGHSPDYNFRKVMRTENSGTIEFCMDVQNGVIMQTRMFGDYFSHSDPKEIEAVLAGIPHEEIAIRNAVAPFEISSYFSKLTVDELVKGLF